MKLVVALIFLTTAPSFAKDTYVRGYVRSNGTYVQPHIRSAPDGQKWNNYGSSGSGSNGNAYQNPYMKDSDKDGVANQYDIDDDNDGITDDRE